MPAKKTTASKTPAKKTSGKKSTAKQTAAAAPAPEPEVVAAPATPAVDTASTTTVETVATEVSLLDQIESDIASLNERLGSSGACPITTSTFASPNMASMSAKILAAASARPSQLTPPRSVHQVDSLSQPLSLRNFAVSLDSQ